MAVSSMSAAPKTIDPPMPASLQSKVLELTRFTVCAAVGPCAPAALGPGAPKLFSDRSGF